MPSVSNAASMPLEPSSSSGWHGGACEVPGQQFIDLVLLMAANDGGERSGQIRQRIDAIELAGLCRTSNYAERARFLPYF